MDWLDSLRNRLGRWQTPEIKGLEGGVSSVLVLLGTEPQDSGQIVLTKRTLLVESHKGQVSFPGGFWEPTDGDLIETALRESEEEIGVPRAVPRLLGPLEPEYTPFGVHIFPWVAQMTLPFPFRPNPTEVDRVLYLPVDRLIGEGLKKVEVRVGELVVPSTGIEADGELIWGATARILEKLRQRLLSPSSP